MSACRICVGSTCLCIAWDPSKVNPSIPMQPHPPMPGPGMSRRVEGWAVRASLEGRARRAPCRFGLTSLSEVVRHACTQACHQLNAAVSFFWIGCRPACFISGPWMVPLRLCSGWYRSNRPRTADLHITQACN